MHGKYISEASTYNAWEDVPLTYLLCELDRAVPVDYQEGLVDSLGASIRAVRLHAGHSPFLSMPTAVLNAICGAQIAG